MSTEFPATRVDAPPRARTGVVVAFTSAILLSAALLFVVQPMVGKMILPLLGGTSAVWNTCMVFFQACLLIGYAYAHLSTKWLPPRVQPMVHVGLMLLPLLVLPIGIAGGWAPPAGGNPVGWVLLLLAAMTGLPFVVVSTSGPLLQRWFARTGHPDAHDPYFLYTASNLGSMIALLGYPLLIEPTTRLAEQSWGWAAGYVALVAVTAWCAVVVMRASRNASAQTVEHPEAGELVTRGAWRERVWWVVLAFVPSSYLLGATSYATSDLSAMPLLWVVPLALYLLSFIFVFARRQVFPHRWAVAAMPFATALTVVTMLAELRQPILPILLIHLVTLFLVAMVCHGELARLRPPAARLTEFYLLLSVGGVLGGAFNALLAPVLFPIPLEYSIAIVLACFATPNRESKRRGPVPRLALDVALPPLLVVLTWAISIDFLPQEWGRPARIAVAAVPAVIVLTARKRPIRFGMSVAAILGSIAAAELSQPYLKWVGRSYFAAHKVQEVPTSRYLFHELVHGTTLHGQQRIDPSTRTPIEPRNPTSYYHPDAPLGRIMHELRSRPPEQQARDVAVVGLGTGSLAAYAEPGVRMKFYEIDALVKEVAENPKLFTFLPDARQRGATIEIVLGDARLTLAGVPDGSLDLLVLDAFSGDAIPAHLLTREAMNLYATKMRPDGLIAFHISNRFLDLRPVVANLARHAGWAAVEKVDAGPLTDQERAEGKQLSSVVLMARDPASFGELMIAQSGWQPMPEYPPKYLWTDDFSNIVGIFKW